MDHGSATRLHEERRFFDDVVTDVDDHVSRIDGAMHEVVGRKGRVAEELIVILVDDAFAHLRRHKRNAGLVNKLA